MATPDEKRAANEELAAFRRRKAAERQRLLDRIEKERNVKTKTKVSEAVLEALLPSLQGKHGARERSRALRALNGALGRKGAVASAPTAPAAGMAPTVPIPGTVAHAQAVMAARIAGSRSAHGTQVIVGDGFTTFSPITTPGVAS